MGIAPSQLAYVPQPLRVSDHHHRLMRDSRPDQKETNSNHSPSISMSSSPTRAPVDGMSDTFILAQNILRLAATPSSLPSRENLEIAVAVYQAAMKLQSPPIYEASGSNDIVNIQRQLDDLKQVGFPANFSRSNRSSS